MPVSPEARQEFLSWVASDKKFTSKVYNGSESLFEDAARIPFISPMLTWATGGGLKVGHMNRWYGPEGSGKSLTNLGLIFSGQNYPEVISRQLEYEIKFREKMRQKIEAAKVKKRLKSLLRRFPDGMNTLIFDTEQRFEFGFAEQIGINTRNGMLEVIDENIIENIAEQMAAAMEAYHIVIVDSTSNAQTIAEDNLDPGDELRASAPRAWARLKKVRRRLDRMENTIIFVDQVRSQLGSQTFSQGKMQTEVSAPKIRFFKHNVSLAIAYFEGKKLYLTDEGVITDDYKKASDDFKALGAQGKEVAGLEMRCKIDKNSTGKPNRNATLRFKFPVADYQGELVQAVGFEEGYELLNIAEHFHIIESGGGGMFYLTDDDFNRTKVKWKGEAKAIAGIMEEEEIRNRIMERLVIDF